ncbi:unnamed protein product, partial [Meganyctiphanes norvegica]
MPSKGGPKGFMADFCKLSQIMDENFSFFMFRQVGRFTGGTIKTVIKNIYASVSMTHNFSPLCNDRMALAPLKKLHSRSTFPLQPVRFKLNHSSTRGATTDKEFSLWVGDLTPDVDDFALYKTFGSRYNSIKTAKVIYDPNGSSKGFAFVRFYSEDEYKDALTHMNGFKGLGQKPLKVSYAVPKKQHYPGMNPQMSGDYSQYYEQYWNNYAAWQNYESKDASKEDFEPVEWNTVIDVDKINKNYIERSEELWQAIEKVRWSFWEDEKQDE